MTDPAFLDWLRGWLVSGVFIFQVLFGLAFALETRRFAAITAAGSSLCSLGAAYIFLFTDWALHFDTGDRSTDLADYDGRRQGWAMVIKSLDDLDSWGLIFAGFGVFMGVVAWWYWRNPAARSPKGEYEGKPLS